MASGASARLGHRALGGEDAGEGDEPAVALALLRALGGGAVGVPQGHGGEGVKGRSQTDTGTIATATAPTPIDPMVMRTDRPTRRP
jgi:hypothetical protein